MKSIRVHGFGGPEVLKLEEVPDPRPGPGEVLVRVAAIGVNPFEAYIRAGKYGPRSFPFTPGVDAGGVVEAVGAGVTRVKPGDRVYTAGTLSGSYAEKTLCAANMVHPLPDHVTFAQGAAVGVPYATAYRALFLRAAGRAGEIVFIHGASGGVGIAAVQLARAAGFTVIGTAGTEAGRQLVLAEGAHHALDHRAEGYLNGLMELTGAKGANVILEMLANVNLASDLSVLAKNGRVIVIGSRGKIEIDPRETMGREADIRGMSLMNASETELLGIHAALVAGLENRTLRPIVGVELPLAEAARAQELIMESSGAHGKIVLTVSK
jgi:NADPH:quinone reductase